MKKEVLDYIKTKRICVLAVEMLDGSPHAATVHFAHKENPMMLFFETDKSYRKSEPILNNQTTRASIVIGVDESEMKTLQLDGVVRKLHIDEEMIYQEVYLSKFKEKISKFNNPNIFKFVFIPNWWKFTDWTRPEGKKIWTSRD